jgi:hypothetical protein
VTDESFAIGILTKNRPALVTALIAQVQDMTKTPFDLVVSVDHDPKTERLLNAAYPGIHLIRPQGRGIPAQRNRLMAELGGHDHIALLEDDHHPTVTGWDVPYLDALRSGVTEVIYRLGPAHGPIRQRRGDVMYREGLGCPVMLLKSHAYQVVGAWAQEHFGAQYGLDDGHWGHRARRAGLFGPVAGPWWPCLDDDGQTWVDVHDPPSSDGKTADQRMAEVRGNLPWYLQQSIDGDIWLPNPEAIKEGMTA